MSRWPTVNLRRVASLGTGHTPRRQHPEYWENCTIPWLTLADVWQLRDDSRTTVTETSEAISELGVQDSSAVVHPARTVAMSRTASVGYSAILGRDMATSQDFVTWRCGPLIDPRFLLHSLRGQRRQILGLRMGSTHQTIYMPDIERISTTLPPLPEQRAIADYLDAETARIDALIAKKRRMIELLNERRVATVESRLRAWDQAQLKRVASIEYGLGQPPPLAASGTPIIRATNIDHGRIDTSNLIYARLEDLPLGRAPLLEVGDILVVRSGALTGDSAIVTDEWAGAAPGYDLCVRQSVVDPFLLAPQLLSQEVLAQIELLRSRAAQPHLNREELGEVLVRVPPSSKAGREARTEIELVAEQTWALVSRLTRQIELLGEHRQALIAAAVSGELRVPGLAA